MRVLNFGSLNVDTFYSVPHIVLPGETIAASKINRFSGGKGLNQSIALSKSGIEVYHMGKIGADGIFLKEELQSAGVNTDYVMECGVPSGNAFIQNAENGENSIVIYGGANQSFTKEEIDTVLADFKRGDIFVTQNETNNTFYAIEKAKEKGMRVAFNPSPMDDNLKSFDYNNVTWLVINEVEGKGLTGENNPDEIINKLIASFPNIRVVLTLGGGGSIYAAGDYRYKQSVFDVRKVDTTAAGDTFLGYFIGLTARGKAPELAMRKASAAAAMAIMVLGAAHSIPKIEGVDEFLRERKNEFDFS